MSVIWFLIVGVIAGWLAGALVKGGGFGRIGDLVVGGHRRPGRRASVRLRLTRWRPTRFSSGGNTWRRDSFGGSPSDQKNLI